MKCPKCHYENPSQVRFCNNCGYRFIENGLDEASRTMIYNSEGIKIGNLLADRYRINNYLGLGSLGKVYVAIEEKLNETVALKILKSAIATRDQTVERFRNELKLAQRISHENICKLYGIFKTGEYVFIVMDYIHGESLKSIINRAGAIDPKISIRIAKQICKGLDEAHGFTIIHNDLKSQNIMITKEGKALIMDLGIACTIKAEGTTQTGIAVGTPSYMSPEQAASEDVDFRADIYSFGVILYEMLTGELPFKGNKAMEIVLKHKTEQPRDPRELNSRVSEELSIITLKCLQKDKKMRYQKAREIYSDLKKIEQGTWN